MTFARHPVPSGSFPMNLHAIVLLTLLCRFAFLIFRIDVNEEQYWEFGEIARNLRAGNGYSLFHPEPGNISLQYKPGVVPHPSAYMMPGYVLVLYPFLSIDQAAVRNALFFSLQILLSAATVYLLYRFCERQFNRRAALIAALCFALLPDFIYAPVSATPTVLFHFLFLLLLLALTDLPDSRPRSVSSYAVPAASLLVMLRAEFVLFLAAAIVLLVIERRGYIAAAIAIAVLLVLLPWQWRNGQVFDRYIPFTTSGGQNLYRGHNPYGIGAWADDDIKGELLAASHDRLFEVTMDSIYTAHAVAFMRSRPAEEVVNSMRKMSHLWVYNPLEVRTGSVWIRIPAIGLLLFFIAGLIASASWKRHRFAYLFFLHSTLIAMIFFVLPRYQTMLRICMIPFAAYGIDRLLSVLSVRRSSPTTAGSTGETP